MQINADGVTELSNGAGDGNAYDVGLQFGSVQNSVEGEINYTTFTLSSGDGTPLSFEDIDLNSMKVIINSEYDDGKVLGVSGSNNPTWSSDDATADELLSVDDVLGLMTQAPDDEEIEDLHDDEVVDDPLFA